MNRLAFAAALVVPSIASAHPGHSHVGLSPDHHLVTALLCAAVATAGFFAVRMLRRRSEKND